MITDLYTLNNLKNSSDLPTDKSSQTGLRTDGICKQTEKKTEPLQSQPQPPECQGKEARKHTHIDMCTQVHLTICVLVELKLCRQMGSAIKAI